LGVSEDHGTALHGKGEKGRWAFQGMRQMGGGGPVNTAGITEPSLEDTNILFMMLYM